MIKKHTPSNSSYQVWQDFGEPVVNLSGTVKVEGLP